MPLIHSGSKKALQQNMRTLHADIGKSPHVQSRKQAIAIALSTQRAARRKADGGPIELAMMEKRSPFDVPAGGEGGAGGFRMPAQPPQGYYDKINRDQALKRSGVSHPGYRHEVFDPQTGKVMGVYENAPRARSRVDKLDNDYGAYRYRRRMVPADAMSPEEEEMLKGMGFQEGGAVKELTPEMRRRLEENERAAGPVTERYKKPGILDRLKGTIVRPATAMASGGVSSNVSPSYFERQASRNMVNTAKGMLHASSPGRSDRLHIGVGSGGYVMPADSISALGQGNSAAGADLVQRMFSRAKGMAGFNRFRNTGRHGAFAKGGRTGKSVPILAAGGEYVLEPHEVAWVGGGDIKKGHEILDRWVKAIRKKHIKTLRGLPGPKK